MENETHEAREMKLRQLHSVLQDSDIEDEVLPVLTFLLGDVLAQASDFNKDPEVLVTALKNLASAYAFCCELSAPANIQLQ